MPFFRCVFVDKSDHTAFPADITADNLETAKRHAYLKPRIGCQTAASVDRDLARWCHGVSVLGAGGLALSPHELRQRVHSACGSVARTAQDRRGCAAHAIQCRDRAQWAQKSGRCNRIASDAAQGRRGKRTGTQPSLPRPAGYGRRREDQVRPRKASRYGSAAADASHYETDPQRIGGSVRPETR